MTLEEYLEKHCGPHCYGEQDENGVDLSLIRENLKLTPGERLVRSDRGRRSAVQLRKIGEEQRARQHAKLR